ncbi:MAG: hypothetical protein KKC75_07850 [Nanoarchaeota archaeon]|nr:hypothetical protein [Nanoarchaeota archaeon]MBU1946463.1 hypothetical protein [Nanoarchaeota archaeon]
MCILNSHELEIFCKTAKIITRKGHLEINAILQFIGSINHKEDKKIIERLYKLGLLTKHRTNTYELTSIGRMFALDSCGWFKERYK